MSSVIEEVEKEIMVKVAYDVWMRNVQVSIHADQPLTPLEVLEELIEICERYGEHPEALFESTDIMEPQ